VNGKFHELNKQLLPLLLNLQNEAKNELKIEFFSFDSNEGKETFWHSSAHILGQALEQVYGDIQLCDGPPISEGGFFYEFSMGPGKAVTQEDYKAIEESINKTLKKRFY
jgi:threonyl-tRNA synthetase